MPSNNLDHYDAIVVGARCAGAASAMLLARRGMRVLTVDFHDYGSDTLSSHALMRGAVVQLHRWGILDKVRHSGAPAVTSTVFHYGDEQVAIPIKPGAGVDSLIAPRRTVLDRILVDAARAAGADVRHGWKMVDLLRGTEHRVIGIAARAPDGTVHEFRCDLVIGADGLRSPVARFAEAATEHQAHHATAAIYGYFVGLERSRYHWHFANGVAASVIPTNDDATCVCLSLPPGRFSAGISADIRSGFAVLLREASGELAATVAAAHQAGPLRAFAGVPGFMRTAAGPGWALVGDAGYFKDPITAHGITDALRDAELMTNAAVIGSNDAWRRYGEERNDLSLPLFAATEAIASFDWDLETIRPLHLRLNEAMKQEVAAIEVLSEHNTGLAA